MRVRRPTARWTGVWPCEGSADGLHFDVPRRLGLHAAAATDESHRWFERAKRVLAGGVSSSARSTTTGPLPYPLYITHGRGSRIWDADGNQYVDYLLGYGSSILGHTDPELTEAVGRQLDLGTLFGTCNTVEVQLAEQICRMVPCAELVRFGTAGARRSRGPSGPPEGSPGGRRCSSSRATTTGG